jgi:radical SAM protein with 4Fe4S-binding SPASM domain
VSQDPFLLRERALLRLHADAMNTENPPQLALPSAAQLEPVGPQRAPALMGFAAFRELLGAQPDLKELQLQGAGDPLAHPRFFDMVSYAAARGIEVTTTSPLVRLGAARIEECLTSGLARLDVAPTDFDYLARGSGLRRALANVRRLASARKGCRPEVRVILVLQRRHLPLLAELVRIVREHGADALVFQHLWHDVSPARRFVDAQSVVNEDCEAYFDMARAAAGELGLVLALPRSRSHSGPCEQPWRRIHIGATGDALPCAKLKTPQRVTLGNMRRDGVAVVWNGEAFREFRRHLAAGDLPPVCRRCRIYSTKPRAAGALRAAPAAAPRPAT